MRAAPIAPHSCERSEICTGAPSSSDRHCTTPPVEGDASGHDVFLLPLAAPDEADRFGRDGPVQAVDDVRGRRVLCHERDHFGFGKYRAHVGNPDFFLPIQADPAHFFHGQSQRPGLHFKEAARACRAFVVHDEVGDISLRVDADYFGILAADVNDGPGIGEEKMRALCVAGDLGDRLFLHLQDVPSVPGGDDSAKIRFPYSRFGKRQMQRFFCALRGGHPGGKDYAAKDLPPAVHDDDVRACRTGIDARYEVGVLLEFYGRCGRECLIFS